MTRQRQRNWGGWRQGRKLLPPPSKKKSSGRKDILLHPLLQKSLRENEKNDKDYTVFDLKFWNFLLGETQTPFPISLQSCNCYKDEELILLFWWIPTPYPGSLQTIHVSDKSWSLCLSIFYPPQGPKEYHANFHADRSKTVGARGIHTDRHTHTDV